MNKNNLKMNKQKLKTRLPLPKKIEKRHKDKTKYTRKKKYKGEENGKQCS